LNAQVNTGIINSPTLGHLDVSLSKLCSSVYDFAKLKA